MFKVVKQGLRDWQVTKNDEPYAWITNYGGTRMYTVTFRHIGGTYPGFRYFKDAKKFAAS